MPLDLPNTSKEIVDRSRADVQREMESANPFLRNSAIGAIITANCRRVFDFYLQLQIAVRQLVWSTSTDSYLEEWASIFGINRLPATSANGKVVFTGTVGSIINNSARVVDSTGEEYRVTQTATIAESVIIVTSISSAGNLASATTPSNHQYANGLSVTIAGCTHSAYNGTFAITVTSKKEFTYSLASEYTGSCLDETTTSTATFASLKVQSLGFGASVNQESGVSLTLLSPIVGVNSVATVRFGEIGGGTDIETDQDFRARFLERTRNPVSNFNVADITSRAKEVNGVTRVWVQETTPDIGQVTVYFVRDNDGSIIPSSSEVTDVNWYLIGIIPASMSWDDLVVDAPVPVTVDFNINSLNPDTASMRLAVEASLDAFFRTSTNVGSNLDQDAYRAAIWNTVDLDNGQELKDFSLSLPTGDVLVNINELPVLGNVSYSV
tara:strand:- start:2354 stop:3670 length:1317 start_codon:yes stop_codon:yes gene_type:complete